MTKPYRSHDEAMTESLRSDPAFAAEYLTAVIQDGDQAEIMLAFRQVADARGGVQMIAKEASLNASSLYRTLSPKGNPELSSLQRVLGAMGLRLAIEPAADPQNAVAAW